MSAPRPLRVLHYNWVDPDDPEARGGGVTVYLRNLIAAFEARDGIEAGAISAGLSYDLPARGPRWEAFGRKKRRYRIVNSGTLAPGHHSFGHPEQLSHAPTEAAFCDMVGETGPWDIVHFQNLEGIPVGVLGTLKDRFPGLRIVVSLHNYYPICPQVNLWQRETAHCDDYRDGHACAGCLLHQPNARLVRLAHGLSHRLQGVGLRPGTLAFRLAFGTALRLGHRGSRAVGWLRGRGRGAAVPVLPPQSGDAFRDRRATMRATLNAHADLVLGVSDRVSDIARAHGIDGPRIATSYIGTGQSARFAETVPRGPLPGGDGVLHLAYLGYMRRDKGFFFLLDALEALPVDMARRVRLTVAARKGPAQAMARLAALRARLAGVIHHDGYTHDGLDGILAEVDVGLVPVLWEDNLPQVAIEMHARHIPLLTSDRGGARELANCPDMVFPAGDIDAFAARIGTILSGSIDMEAYWAGARPPQGMGPHVDDLMALYAGLPARA